MLIKWVDLVYWKGMLLIGCIDTMYCQGEMLIGCVVLIRSAVDRVYC